jgi:ATP-dependent helicase YprA (DUF1998 family)
MAEEQLQLHPALSHSSSGNFECNLDVAALDALSDGELGDILTKFTEMRTGLSPKDFQLQAAVAAWRNRDTLLIAGTGSGKTLSFVMACFLSRKIVVVIISPLNILQEDQVSLNKVGTLA